MSRSTSEHSLSAQQVSTAPTYDSRMTWDILADMDAKIEEASARDMRQGGKRRLRSVKWDRRASGIDRTAITTWGDPCAVLHPGRFQRHGDRVGGRLYRVRQKHESCGGTLDTQQNDVRSELSQVRELVGVLAEGGVPKSTRRVWRKREHTRSKL